MRIEHIDRQSLTVRIDRGRTAGWGFLGRLASLCTVVRDCGVGSVTLESAGSLPVREAATLRRCVRRVRFLNCDDREKSQAGGDDYGYFVVTRDAGLLCLRHADNENTYSMFVAADGQSVDFASRNAYIISNILGLPGQHAFEIRFCIYELLSNIIEHGLAPRDLKWMKVVITRAGDTISISIRDRGTRFDPRGKMAFNLNMYLQSGKRRGLGLIMMRRITKQLSYERDDGCNVIRFEKSIVDVDSATDLKKEDTMEQLMIGEPQRLEDGSYLIELEGDLDTKGALIMEDLLSQLLEQKMHNVALDFAKVPFVSSAGVGMLLGMVSTLRDAGGDATFVNVTPKVNSVLRLLNLDDYFTMKGSEESTVEL